jgi:signal transduction histidine kinase
VLRAARVLLRRLHRGPLPLFHRDRHPGSLRRLATVRSGARLRRAAPWNRRRNRSLGGLQPPVRTRASLALGGHSRSGDRDCRCPQHRGWKLNEELRAERLTAAHARAVAAADDTRRRIERDLHDGLQQQLVSLALALGSAEATVPPELTGVRAQVSQVARGFTDVLDELREISRGIHPAILSEGGVAPALRTLARRSTVPVELDVRCDRRLTEGVELAAYYIVSEALTNAAKHAHASLVCVELEAGDAIVHLSIRDDGVGGAAPGHGSGLVGLIDRVKAVDGTIDIASPAGGGTSLVVEIPCLN